MPAVRFSQQDFLASKVVKPGRYHAIVKAVTQKAASTDGSAVYKPQLIIVEPGEYKGVPLTDNFSEKAMGAAIRYVQACLGGKEPDKDTNYELANGVGKILRVQTSNQLYNGRITNKIDDYDVADPNFVNPDE